MKKTLNQNELNALGKILGMHIPNIFTGSICVDSSPWTSQPRAARLFIACEPDGTTRPNQGGFIALSSDEIETKYRCFGRMNIKYYKRFPKSAGLDITKSPEKGKYGIFFTDVRSPVVQVEVFRQDATVKINGLNEKKRYQWDHALIFKKRNGKHFAIWLAEFFDGQIRFTCNETIIKALPKKLKRSALIK